MTNLLDEALAAHLGRSLYDTINQHLADGQRAEIAIERVRALHVPRDNGTCAARCYNTGMAPEQWPCPTIRALDEAEQQ